MCLSPRRCLLCSLQPSSSPPPASCADVMLLAFYVWSIELWIRGLDQKRWWLLALAMLFVSAAVLTKYFGITLLPLLAVYTLAHDRRCWAQLLWFCFPIVAVALYDFLSQAQYEIGRAHV